MSSSSRSSLSLYLVFFTIVLPTVLSTNHLFYFCSSSENFTSNDPYDSNLKRLTSYLSSTTPLTGFGLGSYRHPTEHETFGLGLCRGDVSTKECKACMNEAKDDIRNLCPNNKAAIVWYDNCFLKYSNKDFFGQIDNMNRFAMYNVKNVSNPYYFNKRVKEFLNQLSDKASTTTPSMFAAGETKIGESYETKLLYGMAECTRDLSGDDCKKCLVDAIGALPNCCDGKEGGRVVGGSCMVRYEIYPFINA